MKFKLQKIIKYVILLLITIYLGLFLLNQSIYLTNSPFWIFLLILTTFLTIVFIVIEDFKLFKINIIILIISLLPILFSTNIIHSKSYSNLLNIKKVELKKEKLDFKFTRVFNKNMATKKINKIIGQKINGVSISTQFEVNPDNAFVQIFKNKLVWIFPLDYSGFFKWLKQDYIPGYVILDATDEKAEPKLILDYKIKYSKNSFFLQNISRKAYFESNLGLYDYHMEINDNGKPFYIVTLLQPQINIFGELPTFDILLIDAQTGETKKINKEDLNKKEYKWIDRIFSENILKKRIKDYGIYKKGYFNSLFTKENVYVPTTYKNSELWLLELNNKLYWFTGMTSINKKDQSLVSFLLVDAKKNKGLEVSLNNVTDENGAIEIVDSALGSDGIKWESVLPQPFIYKNEFYWIVTIKSNNDIFQKIGILKGDSTDVKFVKSSKDLINVLENKTINDNLNTKNINSKDTIIVNKKIYLEILKKIEELNSLKKQLK